MKSKCMLFVIVSIMIAMFFTGCGPDSKDPDVSENKNDEIVVATYYFPATLEPSKDWDSWYIIEFGLGETLTQYSKTGEVLPWLAESWNISKDNDCVWEIKLREDVVFSNGIPMTATKVKESLERLYSMEDPVNGGNGNPHVHFTFNSIVADDENFMVYIETPVATPDLPGALAYPWQMIVDAEASKDRNTYTESVIGTGPYVFTNFKPGISISGVRNENYWNGIPAFENIEVVSMQDSNMRAMALLDGTIDYTVNLDPGGLEAVKGNPVIVVEEYAGTKTELDHMNVTGILSNKTLRQAIIMGIDGNLIADNVLDGLYGWGYSIIPSGLDFGYNQLVNPYAYNFDAAIALLDDAGIIDTDGDGIRELDGENIVLEYVSKSEAIEVEARIELIKKLGIGVNHIVVDDYLPKLFAREFDIIASHDTATPTGDPAKYLSHWYTGNTASNYSGFYNDEYDEIYEKLMVEFDADKRREYAIQLQQIVLDNAVCIISGYPEYNVAYAAGLEGVNIGCYYYYQITPELRFK